MGLPKLIPLPKPIMKPELEEIDNLKKNPFHQDASDVVC